MTYPALVGPVLPFLWLAFASPLMTAQNRPATGAAPETEIANDKLHLKVYLPDAKRGFYLGTRFDWSGVIHSLKAHGHDYYGPWFTRTDPDVHDFIYDQSDIVAGPCSAITGPVDEFAPVGWDQTKAGGTFLKIGVGALHKPDDSPYDNYRLYQVADGGQWTIDRHADAIDFTQTLTDSSGAGYAYVYRKKIRLPAGQAQVVLAHSLKNTGTHALQTKVYNHNFLVLDHQAPGPGVTITLPFTVQTSRPPLAALAEIRGNRIVYLKALQEKDVVAMPIEGFSASPADHDIRIDYAQTGAFMRIRGDRPLLSASLWSIRTVLAVEPFVSISIEPGREFSWTTTYEYGVTQ